MTSTVNYDDTTKTTSEFFTKLFPANGLVKVGTETKSDNLTLKTTSQRSWVKDRNTGNLNEVYDTTIEDIIEFKDQRAKLEAKLQTSNVYQLTLTRSDVVKGLKVSAGALQDLSKDRKVQRTVNVGAEFAHERVFLKVNAGVPVGDNRPFPVTGNLVVQPVENVYVGTKFNFKYATGEKGNLASELEFKAATSVGSTKVHATGTLDRKLGLFVHHNLSDNQSAGLQVRAEYPLNNVAVDVALQHRVCKSVQAQGKLNFVPTIGETKNTGLRLGLGATYSLPNTSAVATFGADFNLMKATDYSAHTLGFELKLK